jgi:hypothetical protein
LKNNKAAGADSITAELLKNGEPNLVDALHEAIQQKGDKLDCKYYRGICLLNVTYKVYAKILYEAFYLTLTRPFSITRLGLNQVNQQQTNSLHCAKSKKNAISLTSQHIIYS